METPFDNDFCMILGARGSMPVSGQEFSHYGGATTCILLRLDGHYLILDAGTGILNLDPDILSLPELHLILTHPHMDHLLGLGLFPYLFHEGKTLHVYADEMFGNTPQAFLEKLYNPPLWPAMLSSYPAEIACHTLQHQNSINGITIETIHGVHPGGVSIVKASTGQHSVVLATDNTYTPDLCARLVPFAEGADLLLLDGQYNDVEWEKKQTYGHSTWSMAEAVGKACHARQMRIIHHDPYRTDEELEDAGLSFGREWEMNILD